MGRVRLKAEDKKKNLTIRVSKEDRELIEVRALKYCWRERKTKTGKVERVGKVSEWIRYAAIHCVPKKEDLE
jgi:hypothetical protein